MVFTKKRLQLYLIVVIVLLSFIGNFQLHSLVCSFSIICLFYDALLTPCSKKEKFTLACFYSILFIAQTSLYNIDNRTLSNQFLTSFLIMTSFTIGIYLNSMYIDEFDCPYLNDDRICFNDLKILRKKVIDKKITILNYKQKLTLSIIKEVVSDIPRHSCVNYINFDSLSDAYFDKAESTLDDLNIYIVCSDTGSPASEVISTVTHKVYNHISLSFDRDMETLISYNGGEKIFPPGLNYETIQWFYKKEDSSILIYKLAISKEQKQKIIEKVRTINRDGSAYNLLGMILNKSYKPNIMFCSQFVYAMLECADAVYFTKPKRAVRPTDFIELDYERKLQLVEKISLNNDLKENVKS